MAAACCSASAAELTTALYKDKTVVIVNGELAAGDASRFKDLLKAAAAAGKPVSAVRFNSTGGSLTEGVRLAAIIYGTKIATVVVAGATCANACFIPFIAGNQKVVSATATIGIPGAAEKSDHQPAGNTPALVREEKPALVRVVQKLGLLDAIVTKMMATPEGEVSYLTLDDLRAMGATMTGKPTPQRSPSSRGDERSKAGVPQG